MTTKVPAGRLPSREPLLNEVVNIVPLVGLRMRLYQALGVRFHDLGTTTIMLHAEVWSPDRLTLGADTVVGRHTLLDARGGIELGQSVNVSSYARLMSAKHRIDSPGFEAVFEPIRVGDRAWIALGATVLGGVTIGEGAVVAAGAVVTRDVPAFTVVGGVPAEPIGSRREDLDYRLAYRPDWL